MICASCQHLWDIGLIFEYESVPTVEDRCWPCIVSGFWKRFGTSTWCYRQVQFNTFWVFRISLSLNTSSAAFWTCASSAGLKYRYKLRDITTVIIAYRNCMWPVGQREAGCCVLEKMLRDQSLVTGHTRHMRDHRGTRYHTRFSSTTVAWWYRMCVYAMILRRHICAQWGDW